MDTNKKEHDTSLDGMQPHEQAEDKEGVQPLPELEQEERKQGEQGLKAEQKGGLLGEMQRAMPTAEGMRELEEVKRARQDEEQQAQSSGKTAKDG